MDPGLRRAWTAIVTADDYEQHMASIGQAQGAAELARSLVGLASIAPGRHITIAGAGTGQMFDLVDPDAFRGYRLTCSDLNPSFLARLKERVDRLGLETEIVEDDIECTRLAPGADLLLAALLLEHIDWRRGVEIFARLRPGACGIILQENPPEMTSAVTPGRRLLPSIAKAVEVGRPTLVPREELIEAMATGGYGLRATLIREVADGKRLAGLLFAASA